VVADAYCRCSHFAEDLGWIAASFEKMKFLEDFGLWLLATSLSFLKSPQLSAAVSGWNIRLRKDLTSRSFEESLSF
jgi:hypothetical protein